MFDNTFYELEVTKDKDDKFGQNLEEFDNAYNAETRCDEKMSTGVKAQKTMTVLNIVVGADGSVICNEYFSKISIGAEDVVKYHMLYAETFNDGTTEEPTFSRFDDLPSCVGAFYSKKAESREKANLETAMCKVFNSHGGFEEKYCYAWDKNPAPAPEPVPPVIAEV